MVELTFGGTWLKWSSLARKDRRLALVSFVTAGLGAVPLGLLSGRYGWQVGFRLGSGGLTASDSPLDWFIDSPVFDHLLLASAFLFIVSAVAWWRFSLHQDEMFNRIQNFALGSAGSSTLAIGAAWWLLSQGGWIAPLPLGGLLLIGYGLLIGFWFYAVRRWA
jgi:hypothetical protein